MVINYITLQAQFIPCCFLVVKTTNHAWIHVYFFTSDETYMAANESTSSLFEEASLKKDNFVFTGHWTSGRFSLQSQHRRGVD